MNKKILSLVLIMMLLIGGLVTLTGCGNKNLTADVILEQRSYKVFNEISLIVILIPQQKKQVMMEKKQ